ncbi:hypothetical protein HHK36_028542 [Tetracentron sinense]|uniref:Ubiquitin-like protease family profile domain-containing protein n=1 Tax=Tetracentron sinense TaxID=13715 RepID=A0A834YCM7_TETSI|nr:hypothetical protein HHK36_028542 [Tetracentron sinense]
MLKVDDSGEGFQRTFILYVLCTLFVPHAKQYVSEKYLHTLVDMKTVRKIAWDEFAYSTLVEVICRVKDEKVTNVGGFVLFLQILPCDMSTKLDERGNEVNEQPLLVLSEGLPNLASGVKDEHLHHNDLTELLSKALEQISNLQCIIGEHEAWHVEVEKELARRELHDTQMSYVIEDLRQKIVTQDTIIETLQEQLSKKETSTENDDIVVCIDETFVYRAAFKTLEPGGLLDDMVFIPVNRSGVHWFLVVVDLFRRKVTILDSMMPRRTEQIAPEIRTLGDIEAYMDKIAMSLLLSPLNREDEEEWEELPRYNNRDWLRSMSALKKWKGADDPPPPRRSSQHLRQSATYASDSHRWNAFLDAYDANEEARLEDRRLLRTMVEAYFAPNDGEGLDS